MRLPLHLVNVDVKPTAHLSVSWILTNTRFFLIRWGLKKCKMHYRPLAKKKSKDSTVTSICLLSFKIWMSK